MHFLRLTLLIILSPSFVAGVLLDP
jgi:hypothetical protein